MLQPSREDSTNAISPNLLKNFNAYEILEPQRSHNGPNVANLIDFDNDPNKSTHNPEISASFIDKTNDYGLIDAFQNIFVSPQQIKSNETEKDDVNHSNINYSDFFDKLESGDKFDWSVQRGKEEPSSTKCIDINSDFKITPKVLVPTIDLDLDSDRDDLDDQHDELIDQLMSRKNIEKQTPSHNYSSQLSTSKIPLTNTESYVIIKKPVNTNIESEIKGKSRVEESTQIPHLECQIGKGNEFIVRAMIKDEKAFRRNRIVKSDREKLNYTKGPDVTEKKVVLPQIMRRLTERKLALAEEKLWGKRLILDSGTEAAKSSCPTCSKSTDTIKMNSNANIAAKSVAYPSKMAQSISKTLSNSSELNSSKKYNNNLSIKASDFTALGAKSLITSTKSLKSDPSLNVTNISKISFDSTVVPISLGLNSRALSSSSKTTSIDSGISNEIGALSDDDCPIGTFRPVVLMEDCNKERLLAWKRSQKISNLVRTGRFNP